MIESSCSICIVKHMHVIISKGEFRGIFFLSVYLYFLQFVILFKKFLLSNRIFIWMKMKSNYNWYNGNICWQEKQKRHRQIYCMIYRKTNFNKEKIIRFFTITINEECLMFPVFCEVLNILICFLSSMTFWLFNTALFCIFYILCSMLIIRNRKWRQRRAFKTRLSDYFLC